MIEGIEPKQSAFFPGENGSVTYGQIEILPGGFPNMGKRRIIQDLDDEFRQGLKRVVELHDKISQTQGRRETDRDEIAAEIDDTFDGLNQNLTRREQILGLPIKK